ncbi:hypothetical protein PsorP6_014957 [Peronosclerospora sorghi]|uniref:Uncharacterized protein n=1 Tax=Peronosclerospora sorghi TaxID=230839 RepID=A0ACC0VSM7_9STRA|nr:hypothetical protein PsorP6_014957 [Peronosclerospora sorghi]
MLPTDAAQHMAVVVWNDRVRSSMMEQSDGLSLIRHHTKRPNFKSRVPHILCLCNTTFLGVYDHLESIFIHLMFQLFSSTQIVFFHFIEQRHVAVCHFLQD